MARAARLVWVDRVPLAFGLDWVPLLGDPEAARAQARRQGASHRVVSGDPPAALGLARGLPAGLACWSAADLLARRHPRGTVACVLPLDDGTCHVLAAHEGVALARADRAYPDADLAGEAIEALRQAHPKLQLLAAHAGAGAGAPGLLEALAGEAAGRRPLEPVRRRGRRLALLVLAAGLGAAGWLRWGGPADAAAAPDPDARADWYAALERTLASRPLHGEAGTRALLDALYRQPARLGGWSLHELRCQPRPDGALWQCVGEYRRQGRLADNRALLRAAPADWRLDFPSLDIARAAWTLSLPGRRPEPRSLPRAGLLARDWASALQAVLPAFPVLRLDAGRPLAVPAPRDAQGREPPLPEDFPRLSVRALRVEGPLRSGALLAPLARAVSWHKAALTLAPGARPDVRASRLMLHLEGTVYENRS
ncbi:hypothetical protein [Castellaniella defragrans]|jgi:hypothetical protein|uniref:Uncharacterized protein n=1 Tax=Castellaniella defragrans (strain DSM 12143 / CCUG 39792 / 65Phen) TaxID=1437824 RepID=W8X927_CASD6|nr:hypothetical protein [Castellaniella defragrans]CDM24095.1 hypothetical protein BN940_08161 [Castellaniella defragrans 65Phen]